MIAKRLGEEFANAMTGKASAETLVTRAVDSQLQSLAALLIKQRRR